MTTREVLFIRPSQQTVTNTGNYIEEKWLRFLEDYYITFDTKEVDSSKLFELLNIFHKDINFTMKLHDLDV